MGSLEIPHHKVKKNYGTHGRWVRLLCLIMFSLSAQAQELKLSGTLLAGDDHTSLPGATVQLVHLSDSAHLFTTTNEIGEFGFANLKKGEYTLNISYVGYEPLSQRMSIAADQKMVKLLLAPKAELLNEIVVVEKMPEVIQKGDTTEFNSQAYKTQPDASAEDMLRKMPGIIMVNGVVQAQGEEVKQVLVDGKPFFGNDASAALKHLPAEVIDKIQVFDKQSEQAEFTGFDDGQSAKTINIITRPDKRDGQFGKLFTGYGLHQRYGLGGNVNVFRGNQRFSIIGQSNNINVQNFATEDLLEVVGGAGQRRRRGDSSGGEANNFLVNQQHGINCTHSFGINYTNSWGEKMEISGSYFFNKSSNSTAQSLNREIFLSADSSQFYEEKSSSASSNGNHRLYMKMVYKISERNSLIFQPNLSLQENSGDEQSSATIAAAQGNILNTTLNDYHSDLKGIHFSGNLLYRHRFEKKGRTLSLRFNTLNNRKNGVNQQLTTQTLPRNEVIETDSLNQSGILDNQNRSYGANAVYTEPVGSKASLQFNYEASLRNASPEQLTYRFEEVSQAYTLLDSALSNQLTSAYFSQSAGTALRLRQGNLSFTAKVNYQLAKLSNDQFFPFENTIGRTFQNVLPSVLLHYRWEGGSHLRISYKTGTSAPEAKDLQSVINNSNPLMLRQGNPVLKQSYQHMLSGRFGATHTEKATSFFVMLSGSYTEDYVGRSTLIATRDTLLDQGVVLQRGAQLTRPVNLEQSWNLRSFMSYGLPLRSLKSNLNFNASVNYNRMPGLMNMRMSYANNIGFGMGLVLSSTMSEQLDFTLSSRSNYNLIENTLRKELNNNYFNQNTELKLHARTQLGFFAETDLNHQWYAGLADGFDQSYWLLNVSIGKKVFKNQLGELKLTVFDLLNQNNSIARNVGESYVEDVQTNVLNSFAMLTFTYHLRNFGM